MEASPEAAALTVRTTVVVESPALDVTRSFTGTVRSGRNSRLGFERGGLVAKVLVDSGDRVEAGDVVARLDVAKLVAERRRLRAQLAEVDANVGIAGLTQERVGSMARRGYASTQSSDEARFSLVASEARREQLRASIASLDIDLAKSRLVAPFTGTVSLRLVDEGTVVAAGAPVVRFLEAATTEVVVGVPVAFVRELPVGSRRPVIIDGQAFDATVSAVVREIDPTTRTRRVVLELPANVDVVEGQTARIAVARRLNERGIWLPRTALTEGLRGLFSVYAVSGAGGNQIVDRREVEVIHAEAERVFVRGTLAAGDKVVATGLHRIVPGQRVVEERAAGEP